MNEIELMLKLDNRNKRRVGSGVFHRASRLGFIRGGVKTQYDYLTRKEKKQLNGEVIVSNMYSDLANVPSLEELQAMEIKDSQNIMKVLMRLHSKSKIQKHWGITPSKFYGFLVKIGLYERKNGKFIAIGETQSPASSAKNKKKKVATPKVEEEVAVEVAGKTKETKETYGFRIEFNNIVTFDEAESRLLAFSTILNKEKKYKLSIHLVEIE